MNKLYLASFSVCNGSILIKQQPHVCYLFCQYLQKFPTQFYLSNFKEKIIFLSKARVKICNYYIEDLDSLEMTEFYFHSQIY